LGVEPEPQVAFAVSGVQHHLVVIAENRDQAAAFFNKTRKAAEQPWMSPMAITRGFDLAAVIESKASLALLIEFQPRP
jgi:hypothetical protein